MSARCDLCRERPPSARCYVRRGALETAACRMCWEQVFLDPRRVLASLRRRSGSGDADLEARRG